MADQARDLLRAPPALYRVRTARMRLDAAEHEFAVALREARRAGYTLAELEEPSGLKRSRIGEMTHGWDHDSVP